jgi:hypothetical protein
MSYNCARSNSLLNLQRGRRRTHQLSWRGRFPGVGTGGTVTAQVLRNEVGTEEPLLERRDLRKTSPAVFGFGY